uniref:Putative ovule protein n=1 Tax=Solanum chacoense TaxID=4108 RepID=A0A0V0GJ18_SOLCH
MGMVFWVFRCLVLLVKQDLGCGVCPSFRLLLCLWCFDFIKDHHWEFFCKFLLCDLIKILAFSTLSFCFSFFLSVTVLIRMLVCFLLFEIWGLLC